MLESTYQARLIRRLEGMFPGCFILKNDSSYLQGVPDLLILYKDKWAMLEAKANENAPVRPNQPYYIELLNSMSFAAFIYPSNETEILRGLQQAFEV
jgi:hypothetical protein